MPHKLMKMYPHPSPESMIVKMIQTPPAAVSVVVDAAAGAEADGIVAGIAVFAPLVLLAMLTDMVGLVLVVVAACLRNLHPAFARD